MTTHLNALARAPLAGVVAIAPLLLFAIGVAAIWTPPWPPMADLPQHAGQIGLLRDLIGGTSPWKNEVWVNLFTPYLLGYVLALPLSFVMPVAAALKCVLTAAYASFGLACLAIRRELAVSPRLDAFYFVSFLGFAYSWGLYTFLIATPVGLAFIWLSIRYAREATLMRGGALALLGVVLLFSHGLVFLFAVAVGAAIVWTNNRGLVRAGVRALAFIPPLAVAALILIVTRQRDAAASLPFNGQILMGSVPVRVLHLETGAFGLPGPWPLVCFAILALAPFLGGLSFTRSREAQIAAAVTVGAVAFAPDFAWSSAFIYERLTLFLPPAYAWLFSEPPTRSSNAAWRTEIAGLAAGVIALAPHLAQAMQFAAESRDFGVILDKAAPGQRALGLILDLRTDSGPDPAVYAYFPSWYQAEKQGLVDFNFAELHEEVVRFRNVPPAQRDPAFPYRAARFNWRQDEAWRYGYFFVRSAGPPTELFRGASCAPQLIATSGEWRLFQDRAGVCP